MNIGGLKSELSLYSSIEHVWVLHDCVFLKFFFNFNVIQHVHVDMLRNILPCSTISYAYTTINGNNLCIHVHGKCDVTLCICCC